MKFIKVHNKAGVEFEVNPQQIRYLIKNEQGGTRIAFQWDDQRANGDCLLVNETIEEVKAAINARWWNVKISFSRMGMTRKAEQ